MSKLWNERRLRYVEEISSEEKKLRLWSEPWRLMDTLSLE